jgi:hypothetical protein
MSITTQQIQTVLRTYNKQLKLSGLNRKEEERPQRCPGNKVARWQADTKTQRRQKNAVPNRH